MLSIRKCGHKELERYYQLFEMDFDSREMLPKLAVHKALTNGSMELLAWLMRRPKWTWPLRW